MSDNSLTIADILPVKTKDDPELKDIKWKNFKDKLSEEFKGIKWTASLPEVAEKIGDLLNIKIPDMLTAAWTKAGSIKKALEETKQSPGKTAYVELSRHTIESENKPYIEIKINGIPQPKSIIFRLIVSFDLKGFILKIRDGQIKEIQTGTCMAEAQLSFQELTIAKKELFQLDLPGTIRLDQAGEKE